EAFARYPWPGNVRELENACERIAQTCSCGTVRVGCLAAQLLFRASAQPATAPLPIPPAPPPPAPVPAAGSAVAVAVPVVPPGTTAIHLDDRLRELEAGFISWALEASRGNKSKAAQLLNIKRSTLGDRINRCGLGRVVPVTDRTV